jgi:hypothetical protein
MQTKKDLTSPCGLACFLCFLHEDNLTAELKETIHAKWNVPKSEIACKGCRKQDGKQFHIPNGCATLDCVRAKGVQFCSDCADFPCALLAPVADLAAERPHNMKMYNLSRIRMIGLERWIEEAEQINKKYFTVKFAVGKGQAD